MNKSPRFTGDDFRMSNHELPSPATETQLLAWLLTSLAPMNRTRVKQLLRSGRVAVNGQSVTRHDHRLRPGDRINIVRAVPGAVSLDRAGVSVVFEDDSLIVIDKPAGLLTVATEKEKTDTAFVRLKQHLEERGGGRPFVVHRLDRDTSGLLLFARDAAIRDALQANWDTVAKTYLAVVEGVPEPAEGVIENYLTEGRDLRVRANDRPTRQGKLARTRYKLVSTHRRYSLLEVSLDTGRKHQIRVHLAGLGCPIAGDPVYGATTPAGRLALHAWRLAFPHPLTGQPVELEASFPEQLRRMVEP